MILARGAGSRREEAALEIAGGEELHVLRVVILLRGDGGRDVALGEGDAAFHRTARSIEMLEDLEDRDDVGGGERPIAIGDVRSLDRESREAAVADVGEHRGAMFEQVDAVDRKVRERIEEGPQERAPAGPDVEETVRGDRVEEPEDAADPRENARAFEALETEPGGAAALDERAELGRRIDVEDRPQVRPGGFLVVDLARLHRSPPQAPHVPRPRNSRIGGRWSTAPRIQPPLPREPVCMALDPHPYTSRTRVLVTGATGYIGGRLVPRLLASGYAVRCHVRSPRKLSDRPWVGDSAVEIVSGDLVESSVDDLTEQLRGCRFAYYLIHSMISAGGEYAERDRRMARRFATAAARAGVERIIYLGGLGELGDGLSEHLSSRREVGRILAEGEVPVTELRAAMIIGSGSASFEILRYLVERLPVMITPRWVRTECQPIAVTNVLDYLVQSLAVPETTGRTLDIGGADVLSYRELMRIMTEERGLPRRWVLPVPILTPKLSSWWIHLVTPIGHRIARPLAEGLRNRVVARDDTAARLMPQRLLSARESIAAALTRVRDRDVETVWSMAGAMPGDPDWAGGSTFVDERAIDIEATPNEVFRAVCRVGGGHGWYAADGLWRVRGFLDRLVGGPGLRRGRRDPEEVSYGEALDFWRVTELERDTHLRLRAEMRLPGEAELEFRLEAREEGGTRLHQVARFRPKGLLGLAYWYSVVPLHAIVFQGMLGGIRRAAEERSGSGASARPSPSSRGSGIPERDPSPRA